jgi:hypothetical protein
MAPVYFHYGDFVRSVGEIISITINADSMTVYWRTSPSDEDLATFSSTSQCFHFKMDERRAD